MSVVEIDSQNPRVPPTKRLRSATFTGFLHYIDKKLLLRGLSLGHGNLVCQGKKAYDSMGKCDVEYGIPFITKHIRQNRWTLDFSLLYYSSGLRDYRDPYILPLQNCYSRRTEIMEGYGHEESRYQESKGCKG